MFPSKAESRTVEKPSDFDINAHPETARLAACIKLGGVETRSYVGKLFVEDLEGKLEADYKACKSHKDSSGSAGRGKRDTRFCQKSSPPRRGGSGTPGPPWTPGLRPGVPGGGGPGGDVGIWGGRLPFCCAETGRCGRGRDTGDGNVNVDVERGTGRVKEWGDGG